MTMGRSIITQEPIHFDFSQVEDVPTLKFYNVTLHKIGGRWNEFYMGHVVTHLSIQDWCDMKGFRLETCHPGTRWARDHERTNLF